MIEMGVASPSAHGQAMISTAIALRTPYAMRGSGPIVAHTAKVTTATATTEGTKKADTRSATFWTGARLRWASATDWTMRASSVSAPTRSACITSDPVPLIVAPTTRDPETFSAGMGSPVTIDSSTALWPSSTRPSTAIFSPGRTRSRSPTMTWSSGTSSSVPSDRSLRAVFGANPSRARIAELVLLRARSSSTWPRSTSVTITAAASK